MSLSVGYIASILEHSCREMTDLLGETTGKYLLAKDNQIEYKIPSLHYLNRRK